MEIYTLDSLLRRNQVIDRYESLIWTERVSAFGEFELVIHSTSANRRLIAPDTKLIIDDSYRVMTIETVEDKVENDGIRKLTAKGRSLETILEDRVGKSTKNMINAPGWVWQASPATIARLMFRHVCVEGRIDSHDIIPGIVEESLFPEDTIKEDEDVIIYEADFTTLYASIKHICDLYDLGFRITRSPYLGHLHYDVYTGSDRTTSQTILPPIVFSTLLGNLQNTTHLVTTARGKNVAYVYSNVGFQMVYPPNVDQDTVGFDRRVLLVKATDITTEDPIKAKAQLIQRGKEKLSEHRSLFAFDGEVPENSDYKYGRDYNLGDLVNVRSEDEVTNVMRVTEQIFVSDEQGVRSYPTLTLHEYITPGSWAAWQFNRTWPEMTAAEQWNTMPN